MDRDARMAAVLAASPELDEYRRWLAARPPVPAGERDYLFAEPAVRFEPRGDDVLVAGRGLRVGGSGKRVVVQCAEPAAELPVPGVGGKVLRRLLEAIDGQRCLAEVAWSAPSGRDALARLLRVAFGRVLFAPAAVAALQQRLSGIEICRFPSAPYAIERPYWENMIDVATRLEPLAAPPRDGEALLELLRELHLLALMGGSLERFYQPASPGAGRLAPPGALLHAAPHLLPVADGLLFVSGARVRAALPGGERYHALLYQSLGEPEAIGEPRLVVDGLDWGAVVVARAEHEAAPLAWYCPPRPMRPAHFARLGELLAAAADAASRGDEAALVGAAARFHHAFVRLHPFHCANQCLAMSVANAMLRRGRGAGVPHLLLDHHALRLSPDAYAALFARAVRVFGEVVPSPTERLAALVDRHRAAAALIERIERSSAAAPAGANGRGALETLLAADRAAADAALLVAT